MVTNKLYRRKSILWGTGKKRTQLGEWLDRKGYTQEDLVKASKVSRNTVSKVCSDPEYTPSTNVMKKILTSLREIEPNINVDDLWKM